MRRGEGGRGDGSTTTRCLPAAIERGVEVGWGDGERERAGRRRREEASFGGGVSKRQDTKISLYIYNVVPFFGRIWWRKARNNHGGDIRRRIRQIYTNRRS